MQGAGSCRLDALRGSPAILWTLRDGLMTVSVIFVANGRDVSLAATCVPEPSPACVEVLVCLWGQRVGLLQPQRDPAPAETALASRTCKVGVTVVQNAVYLAGRNPRISNAELACDAVLMPQTMPAMLVHLERAGDTPLH